MYFGDYDSSVTMDDVLGDEDHRTRDGARRARWADREARWFDSLGREVDLDNIDREYAMNILCMVLLRRGRQGARNASLRSDPLVQKLRDVVLNGREPNHEDRRRAQQYNLDNIQAGKPFRAPIQ